MLISEHWLFKQRLP